MGIHRLEKFLNASNFSTSVSAVRAGATGGQNAVGPLSLICDGNALVFWLVDSLPSLESDPFPSIYGGEYAELRRITLAFVIAWRMAGVELSVCFDSYGGPAASAAKASTSKKRFEDKLADAVSVETYCTHGTLPRSTKAQQRNTRRRQLSIPPLYASGEVTSALAAAGVKFLYSDGEADAMAARVACELGESCLGVLSQDSDFCAYERISYVPLASVDMSPQLLSAAREALVAAEWRVADVVTKSVSPAGDYDIKIDVITRAKAAAAAGVPESMFIDVALLAGNDYTREPLLALKSTLKFDEFTPGDDDFEKIAEAVNGMLTKPGGPRRVEELPNIIAAFAESSRLAEVFLYSRSVYAHLPSAEGPGTAMKDLLSGKIDLSVSAQNENFYAARLRSCAWTRALYAGVELGLLGTSDAEALEEPMASKFYLGIEPVPFDDFSPSSARVSLPFKAVKALWLTARPTTAAKGVAPGKGPLARGAARIALAPLGAIPGILRVTAAQDELLREKLLFGSESASSAAASKDAPSLLDIPLSRAPLLSETARWSLYSRAASVALTSWEPQWDAPPVDVPSSALADEGASYAEAQRAVLKALGSGRKFEGPPAPCKWLRANFNPEEWRASLASSDGTLLSANGVTGGIVEIASRAIAHLVACTQAAQSADARGAYPRPANAPPARTNAAASLPSLQELAGLAAAVALAAADAEAEFSARADAPPCDGAVSRALGSLPAAARPLIRRSGIISWFLLAAKEIAGLGKSMGVFTSNKGKMGISSTSDETAGDESEDETIHPLTCFAACSAPGDAGGASRESAIAAAVKSRNHKTWGGALLSPLPHTLIAPRAFHALCGALGSDGSGAAPSLCDDGRRLSPTSLLTKPAAAALAAAGERSSTLYTALLCAAFDAFDAPKLLAGYKATADAVAALLAEERAKADADALSAKMAAVSLTSKFSGEGASEGHTSALPISSHIEAVCWGVARNTVVIIKGDTGSGKSTKVPQYVLDQSLRCSAEARGKSYTGHHPVSVPHHVWGDAEANVYVTQPRRVAAITLANRVADERGEKAGASIGYRIGQENNSSRSTRITFCTTGWLLAWLVASSKMGALQSGFSGGATGAQEAEFAARTASDADTSIDRVGPDVGSESQPVSHLILDEVHERGIDTDIVILVVKMAITRGIALRADAFRALAALGPRGGKEARDAALLCYARRTRLLLMSATIDTGIFTDYLSKVACAHADRLAEDIRSGRLGPRELVDACALVVALPKELAPPPLAADVITRSVAAARLSDVSRPSAMAPGDAALPRKNLLAAIAADRPITLGVGSKRYDVEVIYLDKLYNNPLLRNLPVTELVEVKSACQNFNRAAENWTKKTPQQKSMSSVADALIVSERDHATILRVAARTAITLARPGTGDAILIFVPGMADIEEMCDVFREIAPNVVAAPSAKLSSGEEVDEDQALIQSQMSLAQSSEGGDDAGDAPSAEEASDAAAPPVRRQALAADPARSYPIKLIPMHSLIAMDDQMAAFEVGGAQTRIIVATNIAESSITIPGVSAVIDLGRAKQIEYDAKLRTSLLRFTWTSKASAKQRQGRAGRVKAGTCIRMYTESFFETVMPAYDLPEMLRINLENVVLKIKMLGIRIDAGIADAVARGHPDPTSVEPWGTSVNSAKAVLAQSLQPPDMSTIDAALTRLASLGAMESAVDTSEVTTFGRVLSKFPTDITIGRLVAFGALAGVLPDAIIMAAVSSIDVFLQPNINVASSIEEYAAMVSKIARARWLFGRDVTLATARADPEGASLHCWSEPIMARNVYIAYRGVPKKQRAAWCGSLGLMQKRLDGVHATVREVAQRLANDAPHFSDVIRALLLDKESRSSEGLGGHKAAESRPPSHPLNDSWPPPGLFCANTHILRVILVAAYASNLVVGTHKVNAGKSANLVAKGLNPQRSLTGGMQALPPAWRATASSSAVKDTLPARRPAPLNALPDPESRKRREFNGDIARGLYAIGVPRPRLKKLEVVDKTVMFEVGGDWDEDTRTVARGIWAPMWASARSTKPSAPGDDWSAPLNDNLLALLGVSPAPRDAKEEVLANALAAPESTPRLWPQAPYYARRGGAPPAPLTFPSLLGFRPLAHALPVSALSLMMMTGNGPRGLAIPITKPDADSAPPAGGPASLPFGAVAATGASSSGAISAQQARGEPVVLPEMKELGSVYSTSWRTSSVTSGKRAYSAVSNGRGDFLNDAARRAANASARAANEELIGFTARMPQNSMVRLLAGRTSCVGDNANAMLHEALLLLPRNVDKYLTGKDKRLDEVGFIGAGSPGDTAADSVSAVEQLLAVVPSVVLTKSVESSGKASVRADIIAPSLLWRDAEAQALSLLLFSRGVEAQLQWVRTDDKSFVVCSVKIDPFGDMPVTLEPTRITLPLLRELASLRAMISATMGDTELLAAGLNRNPHGRSPQARRIPTDFAAAGQDFQARALLLLGLTETAQNGPFRGEAAEIIHDGVFDSSMRESALVIIRDFDTDAEDMADADYAVEPASPTLFGDGLYVSSGGGARGGQRPISQLDDKASASLLPPYVADQGTVGSWGCPALAARSFGGVFFNSTSAVGGSGPKSAKDAARNQQGASSARPRYVSEADLGAGHRGPGKAATSVPGTNALASARGLSASAALAAAQKGAAPLTKKEKRAAAAKEAEAKEKKEAGKKAKQEGKKAEKKKEKKAAASATDAAAEAKALGAAAPAKKATTAATLAKPFDAPRQVVQAPVALLAENDTTVAKTAVKKASTKAEDRQREAQVAKAAWEDREKEVQEAQSKFQSEEKKFAQARETAKQEGTPVSYLALARRGAAKDAAQALWKYTRDRVQLAFKNQTMVQLKATLAQQMLAVAKAESETAYSRDILKRARTENGRSTVAEEDRVRAAEASMSAARQQLKEATEASTGQFSRLEASISEYSKRDGAEVERLNKIYEAVKAIALPPGDSLAGLRSILANIGYDGLDVQIDE